MPTCISQFTGERNALSYLLLVERSTEASVYTLVREVPSTTPEVQPHHLDPHDDDHAPATRTHDGRYPP